MRYARHSKILEIIKSEEVYTQEDLSKKLKECGFDATQATISRDIKDLGLIKINGSSGKSYYADAPKANEKSFDKYGKILSDTVLSVKSAENLVVIKTLSGCAGAAAEVLDRISSDDILGTIAGDNTILVIVNKSENAENIVNLIKEVVA